MDETQYPPANTKKSGGKTVVILLSILVILLLGGGIFLYGNWQKSKDEIGSLQAQLSAKDTTVKSTETLLKTARDSIRKKDLASFASVIKTYNQSKGGHLTTEGSISKNIYDTQLSKSVNDFTDPKTGQTYGYVAVAPAQSPPPLQVSVIQYQWPGKCSSTTILDTPDQSLTAVATLLEDGSIYCLSV